MNQKPRVYFVVIELGFRVTKAIQRKNLSSCQMKLIGIDRNTTIPQL
jgi:hypothetical protein